MYMLIIVSMLYIYLREYVEKISQYYVFVMDVLFIGFVLYTRYEHIISNGRNDYLFKKEIKIPWFFVVSSMILYVIYKSLTTITSLANKLISLNDYLFFGEQIVFFLSVAVLYIWIILKDLLNITFERGYSYDIDTISSVDTTTSESEEKNKDINVVEEISDEKEEIKKIPVIVITKD